MRLSQVGRNPFERYTAKDCTMTIASRFLNNRPLYDGKYGGTSQEGENKVATEGRFRLVDKLTEKSLSNLFNWVIAWNKGHSDDQRIPLV